MSKMSKAVRTLERADREITHRAAAHRDRPLVKLVGLLSEAADQPPLIALGVGTIVLGAVLRRPGLLRNGVRMLGSELVATQMKSMVKHSVDRTRPEHAIESGTHRFGAGQSHDHEQTSFPSGHTAGAVAIAGSVARDLPAAAIPAYAVAATVAAVQMPRGKHYILDTLVGGVIGLVAQKAMSGVMRVAEPVLVGWIERRLAKPTQGSN